MKYILVSLVAFISSFYCGTSALAANNGVSYSSLSQAASPCTTYYNVKRHSLGQPIFVSVLDDNGYGIVSAMVLGLPRRVLVTVNGIDVSRYQIQRQPVVCSGETVGHVLTFDLRSLAMDAGYFQIQAGQLLDGKNISFSR